MPVGRPRTTELLVDQLFSPAANDNPAVQVVRPFDLLCSGQRCRIASQGQLLYLDPSHLSYAGASLVAPRLEQSIRSSLALAGPPDEPSAP
jgi:hypothetical protein